MIDIFQKYLRKICTFSFVYGIIKENKIGVIFMRNNKGFTMIELIGAVIILGLLMTIAIPNISKLMERFRIDYYTKLEKTVREAAIEFYKDNRIYRPNDLLKADHVDVNSTLVTKNYLSDVKDYHGGVCSNSYVVVIYKGNDNYEYQTCLRCAGDDYYTEHTYCNEAWLNNDNISKEFGSKSGLYIYYNTPREEVRKKLNIGMNVVKRDNNGRLLESASLDDNTILPNNINELDTTPILDADNKKTTTLIYSVDGANQYIDATIYKHKAPLVNINDQSNTALSISLIHNDTFFEATNTTVSYYEWKRNGTWSKISCDSLFNKNCYLTIDDEINEQVSFRFVTNENNVSDETQPYTLKFSTSRPACRIDITGNSKNSWYKELSADIKNTSNDTNATKSIGIIATLSRYVSKITENDYQYDNKSVAITKYNSDGDWVILGIVKDKFGNVGYCQKDVKIDHTAPSLTIENSSKGAWTNSSILLTLSAYDYGDSGINSFEYSDNNGAFTKYSVSIKDPFDTVVYRTSSIVNSQNTVRQIRVCDLAGNCRVQSTNLKIDKGPPYTPYIDIDQIWEQSNYQNGTMYQTVYDLYCEIGNNTTKIYPKAKGGKGIDALENQTTPITCYEFVIWDEKGTKRSKIIRYGDDLSGVDEPIYERIGTGTASSSSNIFNWTRNPQDRSELSTTLQYSGCNNYNGSIYQIYTKDLAGNKSKSIFTRYSISGTNSDIINKKSTASNCMLNSAYYFNYQDLNDRCIGKNCLTYKN